MFYPKRLFLFLLLFYLTFDGSCYCMTASLLYSKFNFENNSMIKFYSTITENFLILSQDNINFQTDFKEVWYEEDIMYFKVITFNENSIDLFLDSLNQMDNYICNAVLIEDKYTFNPNTVIHKIAQPFLVNSESNSFLISEYLFKSDKIIKNKSVVIIL